jgi:hypothetical protein
MPIFSNLMRSSTMSRSQTPCDTAEKCRQCDESRLEAMTQRGLCYARRDSRVVRP